LSRSSYLTILARLSSHSKQTAVSAA